jgi:hypothetical protein
MRSGMRTYWRDPGFWRWWWENRVSDGAKGAIAVMVVAALGIGGFVVGHGLAAPPEAATFTTERVLTVVRKTRVNAPPEVVTKSQTVTQPGETDAVTVRRDGRTVVLRAPGETVTARGPVEQRVVTNARTDTVVRTETANRLTTVTTPGTTETVTREVTQPARTVTETNTKEVTVTEQVTVTEVVTVTETCKKNC